LPGNTWLHRTSAGLKLAVLALSSSALMWVHSPLFLLATCVLVCFLVRWVGTSLQQVWQHLRPLVWMLLVLGGLSVWFQGLLQALEMILRLLTLVLAALVVTMTTPLTQMMQVVVWLLSPFQRLGRCRSSCVRRWADAALDPRTRCAVARYSRSATRKGAHAESVDDGRTHAAAYFEARG